MAKSLRVTVGVTDFKNGETSIFPRSVRLDSAANGAQIATAIA